MVPPSTASTGLPPATPPPLAQPRPQPRTWATVGADGLPSPPSGDLRTLGHHGRREPRAGAMTKERHVCLPCLGRVSSSGRGVGRGFGQGSGRRVPVAAL